jgi:prepilin-type N-terminal cleavage/methylation domain-containing protein
MRKTVQASTLIELLVVIAIIALLLSIFIPGLNMVKRKASMVLYSINVNNISSAGTYLFGVAG